VTSVSTPTPHGDDQPLQDLERGLVVFFRARRALEPEDLAHDTILRVLEQIAKAPGSVRDLVKYAFAVARNVRLEDLRRSFRDARRLVPLTTDTPDGEVDVSAAEPERDHEDLVSTWKARLETLPAAERDLLVRFYSSDKRGRDALAERLRLRPGTLRVRVCRIRAKLGAKPLRASNVKQPEPSDHRSPGGEDE